MVKTQQVSDKYHATKNPAARKVLYELLVEGLAPMQAIIYDHLLFNELTIGQLQTRCDKEHYVFAANAVCNLLCQLTKMGLVKRRKIIGKDPSYLYSRTPIF